MTKIASYRLGELIGTIYLAKNLGYQYKIRKGKKTIAISYVYFNFLDDCKKRLDSDMNYLAGFDKQLFDLDKL